MVAHQASQSMGFSRQEYWSGLPCPAPRVKSNWGEFQESSFSEDIHVNVIRVIKLHMLRKTTHTHTHTKPHLGFPQLATPIIKSTC